MAYTAPQIYAGISAALKAGDMKAAVGLMQLLATVDPAAAALMIDAIKYLSRSRSEESREEHE